MYEASQWVGYVHVSVLTYMSTYTLQTAFLCSTTGAHLLHTHEWTMHKRMYVRIQVYVCVYVCPKRAWKRAPSQFLCLLTKKSVNWHPRRVRFCMLYDRRARRVLGYTTPIDFFILFFVGELLSLLTPPWMGALKELLCLGSSNKKKRSANESLVRHEISSLFINISNKASGWSRARRRQTRVLSFHCGGGSKWISTGRAKRSVDADKHGRKAASYNDGGYRCVQTVWCTYRCLYFSQVYMYV